MSTTIDEVEAVALQLPRAERARLAERLIASLDEDLAIENRWKEEVRRRVEELRSGAVPSIPGDQVFREIEEMLR
ncbi:MAG TPA: addiction module protein [Longimicrobium sp.]|jgi:putative addiction module component (TIGR02574 family)